MATHQTSPPARAADLRKLASYLQAIREQERAALARELHDELGSLLMGAKLDVACIASHLGACTGPVADHLGHLRETLNRGILLKSRVVEGLCPSTLGNLGLVASLRILVREFAAGSGIAVGAELDEVDLDAAAQLAVYRLVQEALTNVGKYAAATEAHVVLLCRAGEAMVSVHDNGRGFDIARLRSASHGLAGMRHRVEDCGGRLDVVSAPGEGTRIAAVMPGTCRRAHARARSRA